MSKSASYKLIEPNTSEGTPYIQTFVSWQIKKWNGKKGSFHTGNREGTIYTQSRFKAWCKKYNITPKTSEIERLPKKVDW